MVRTFKIVAINAALAVLFLVLFDFGALFFLPERIDALFWPYRCFACEAPPFLGARAFPPGYFVAVPDRGFDIAPNFKRDKHWVGGKTYEVWSNEIGCFDSGGIPNSDYIYLAGDSFSWGFAPYDSKFGTLIEKNLGIPVAKCGVPHTGQAHQLSKARENIAKINKSPKLIVVQYFPNDVCNDFAFPHSTIIDGWLVDDKIVVRKDETWSISTRPLAEIAERVRSDGATPQRATFF
jgi:hypothetical protein